MHTDIHTAKQTYVYYCCLSAYATNAFATSSTTSLSAIIYLFLPPSISLLPIRIYVEFYLYITGSRIFMYNVIYSIIYYHYVAQE